MLVTMARHLCDGLFFLKEGLKLKAKLKPALKRGPKAPPGGRVRITVNLPQALVPVVKSLPGNSLSDKLCGLVDRSQA